MASARFLGSRLRLHYSGLLGVATGLGLHTYGKRDQRVCNDGPASAQLSRQQRVKSQGPPSPTNQASHSPPSDKHDGSGSSREEDRQGPYAAFEHDDDSAWANFSDHVNILRKSLAAVDWGSFGDSITDYILPSWARQIPDQLRKVQSELSMEPGSLADDIWHEASDPDVNPEIKWDASVRVSDVLCDDELEFRKQRRKRLVPALARYLDINESEIDPADVPTIAICSSGGGLRALVAGTGSMLATQEDGLFDCVTYTAGVSGSCWLQTLYHTELGKQNFHQLARHLKNRLDVHIAFPPEALKLFTSAPTHQLLLSGPVEKLRGDPGANFGLVDLYGLLLGARLMVPKGELGASNRDMKLSNQRANLDQGRHPLPIYTAVRHEIPVDEAANDTECKDEAAKEAVKEEAKKEAWFQWFEFTPYEVFCEEFCAGIPTWALGRPFQGGRNVLSQDNFYLPEVRIPLMLGIWGSAFCATLSHYYQEIKPALAGIAGFDHLDGLLTENRGDLVKIHPIDPASIPNFVYGMQDRLPPSCPKSVRNKDHLELMDAGMSNNLPIYPLLRPGRDVDILIAFDASADKKKDNWLSVVDGYARQRGISGWPVGTGWSLAATKTVEAAQALDEAQASNVQEAAGKVANTREQPSSQPSDMTNGSETSATSDANQSPSSSSNPSGDLGHCTIWVGSKSERVTDREPPPSKRLEASTPDSDYTFQLMRPSAALTLIYFPFIPHPDKVPGVDPDTSEFMSTWNFVYTPGQVERAIALARANFEEGKERTRRCVRAVYERKRTSRLQRESEEKEEDVEETGLKGSLRREGNHFA